MGRSRVTGAIGGAAAIAAEGGGGSSGSGSGALAPAVPPPAPGQPTSRWDLVDEVDPDIWELCHTYDIDPRKMVQLHQIMLKRADTFESDILKLWDSFKNAREPNAVLSRKLQDMKEGTFIGKAPKSFKAEKRMREFYKQNSIDPLCKDSLADALYDRSRRIINERRRRGGGKDGDGLAEKDMKEILDRLDRDIGEARNPSAIVMRCIPAIEQGVGKWKDIGQLEEAKSGEIRERSPSPSPPKASTKPAEALPPNGRQAPPPSFEGAQPPSLPRHQGGGDFAQRFALAPAVLAAQAARLAQSGLASAGAGFIPTAAVAAAVAAWTASSSPPRESAPTPFDPEALAKRVRDIEAAAALPQGRRTEAAPSAVSRRAAPAPQPAVLAPEPPPKKKAPALPLRLSAASVAILKKKEELPELSAASAAVGAEAAPDTALGRARKAKESKDLVQMSAKELEMAAFATGKPVEELAKMSKKEVRTLVLEVVAGGRKKEKARSRSRGAAEKEKARSRSRGALTRSRSREARSRSRGRRSRSGRRGVRR